MATLACDRDALVEGSAKFAGFSDHELKALHVLLKAETLHAQDGSIPVDVNDLEEAAEGLTTGAGFYRRRRHEAKVYLACADAVAEGAESDCGDVTALWDKAKCFACKSDDEREAMLLYLDCVEVAVGGIAV